LNSTVVTSSLTSVGTLGSLGVTGIVTLTSSQDNSNNYTSGALQVQNGGAAIKGKVYIGGATTVNSTISATDLITAGNGISVTNNTNVTIAGTGKLIIGGVNIKSFAVAMAIGLS
jgi:hypothetical protein